MSWAREFKGWIMKGNLIEIAVGLIIALAFADLVKSFTQNLVTPIIAAIGGQPDFNALDFTINGSTFRYGAFINAVVTFVIVAFILFLIVKWTIRLTREKPVEPTQYLVEAYDVTAINALAADGWTVVAAGDGGVVLSK